MVNEQMIASVRLIISAFKDSEILNCFQIAYPIF